MLFYFLNVEFMENYRSFALTIGDQPLVASFGLFLGQSLHLQLETEDRSPAFFSETGYRSHFFGIVEKKEIIDAETTVLNMTNDKLSEIIKKLFPNYPKTQNPKTFQLSIF